MTHDASHEPRRLELQELERSSVVNTYARIPVEFVRGEGARLWDVRRQRVPGLPLRHLGHERRPLPPAVVAAVREQAGG